MFKSNSGEPYAGKLHVRFLEEFVSNCLIIREGENLLMQKTYLCIDLKSFYASVECVELGLDPFKVNLVVADPTRGGVVPLPLLQHQPLRN